MLIGVLIMIFLTTLPDQFLYNIISRVVKLKLCSLGVIEFQENT